MVVLEQQPTPGGAVHTDEEVADGFRHDTFSAFYPFAAASPALRSLDLERLRAAVAARAGGARQPDA